MFPRRCKDTAARSGDFYARVGGVRSEKVIVRTMSYFVFKFKISILVQSPLHGETIIFRASSGACTEGWWGGKMRGGVGHLSLTRERSEAGGGRPEDGGVGTAKTVKRPPQQPAQPRYTNYWAPLTHKRHPPQPTQPRCTNHWAPRTRKRHQQEHSPQRRTKRNDPTQHAKGRTGDCPGPYKENSNPTECHTGVTT